MRLRASGLRLGFEGLCGFKTRLQKPKYAKVRHFG